MMDCQILSTRWRVCICQIFGITFRIRNYKAECLLPSAGNAVRYGPFLLTGRSSTVHIGLGSRVEWKLKNDESCDRDNLSEAASGTLGGWWFERSGFIESASLVQSFAGAYLGAQKGWTLRVQ